MQEVLQKKLPKDLLLCKNCYANTREFKLHEKKDRLFYVVIDNIVEKINGLLGRWKCAICKTTFTHYPDFAIPYKNYVKENIFSFCKAYLENDTATYASVVKHENCAIGYETSFFDGKDLAQLEGSSVWRWIDFLGSLDKTINNACGLIKERSPTCPVFREIQPVIRRKYRSKKRRKLLEQCFRFFNVKEYFKKLFSSSILPEFAIKNCWT
jgi:hypothetical protein